ncbi:epoxide hydrolase family protein [Aneurinibacillus tyrosinisolvens]|uniref:epoxide hydrolase family protein n=1 Tax=Aneurinibacillus tyrosinisolvens TaxID=1443435 RepID=UPI00069A0452|nr:epoxide hydrolase N-terminal domain-containing protein [Aneurinibacillus tyrosinisolvens]
MKFENENIQYDNITQEPAAALTSPRPFKISIDQAVLDDLSDRLAQTRWPDRIEGSGWSYGTDDVVLRDLITYWRDDFDWRAQEQALNELPQFMTTIDGIDVHFIHLRGNGPAATPLLMLHGWPSSFVQMAEIAPLLADPAAHGGRADQAFDVVIPSLPGFGFSGRPQDLVWTLHVSLESFRP